MISQNAAQRRADEIKARRQSEQGGATPCGHDFEHDWHGHVTERGKIIACDGIPRDSKVNGRTAEGGAA